MKTASLALLVPFAFLSAAAATDWVAYYKDKVAEFKAANAKLDPKGSYVVLVGDSITEGFTAQRVAKYLPASKDRVLNRGISSDGVGVNDRGVLHRLDESVFDCHPGQIVLNVGVNDLDPARADASATAVAKKLREVVVAIQAKLPKVPIVLELVSPTRDRYDKFNEALDRYREKERALAKELGLKVVDCGKLLGGEDGKLKAEHTSDGLHWSDAAYKVVGEALEKALAEPAPKPGK